MKNLEAINKIIGELSYRDFEAARKKCKGKLKSYSLGADTMEAIETKWDYRDGKITEEEYKAYCLKYNLRTANETQ